MKTIMKPNMKHLLLHLFCATVALSGTSQAATVIWNSVQQITSSSQVIDSSTGLSVAYGTGGATLNGITFVEGVLTGNAQNGYSIALSGFDGIDPVGYTTNTGATNSGTNARVPTGMEALLKGGVYDNNGSASFTISGLTSGKEYTIQLFVADYRNEALQWGQPYDRNQTITSGNTSGALNFLNNPTGPASFVVGKFTADATSQVFNIAANQSAQINAISIVPEPTAAMLGGLGFLCLLRRRR
jgi:hypothetical protein